MRATSSCHSRQTHVNLASTYFNRMLNHVKWHQVTKDTSTTAWCQVASVTLHVTQLSICIATRQVTMPFCCILLRSNQGLTSNVRSWGAWSALLSPFFFCFPIRAQQCTLGSPYVTSIHVNFTSKLTSSCVNLTSKVQCMALVLQPQSIPALKSPSTWTCLPFLQNIRKQLTTLENLSPTDLEGASWNRVSRVHWWILWVGRALGSV